MLTSHPSRHHVAGDAQCTAGGIPDEEIGELDLMRVMTRRALDLLCLVQTDGIAGRRKADLRVVGRIRHKRDGVSVREIRRQVRRARRDFPAGTRPDHLDHPPTAGEPDGHRAVVTAQAQLGRAIGLTHDRVQGGAAIRGVVRHLRKRMIPQGNPGIRVMRRMAEDADLLLAGGAQGAGSIHGKVVLRLAHVLGDGPAWKRDEQRRNQNQEDDPLHGTAPCASSTCTRPL